MQVVALIGNPRAGSRTRDCAEHIALALTPQAPTVVDLSELSLDLFKHSHHPDVDAAVATTASADLLVVASPTYKGTYTGVLKLFLERFASGQGLKGTIAVPLMLGAGRDHALAVELYLKPLLTELGASCPAPGLFLSDSTWHTDGVMSTWLEQWHSTVTAMLPRHHSLDSNE